MIEGIFSDNLVDVPDDIERVIEDGGEERRDDKESDNEDEKKDENKKENEKEKIKRKLGPRLVLNAQRLKGPRGIATIEEFFSDIKLRGKGREKENLDVVMKRLELWTHRLYPRGQFDDCLKKIEKLGTNRTIVTYITKIRLGLEDGSGETDLIRDVPDSPPAPADQEDAFDQLLTPAAPAVSADMEITTDQRDRMLYNRLIAEERRAARIKRAQELKERFKAQEPANSESVVGDAECDIQTQNEIQQEQERIGTVGEMDVDDNQETIGERVNVKNTSEQEIITEEMVTDERERIAEEMRAARIMRAQELKERFSAQNKANSRNVIGDTSVIQPLNALGIEQRNNLSEGQMEIDNNRGTISEEVIKNISEPEIIYEENKNMNKNKKEVDEIVVVDPTEKLSENLSEKQDIESSCPEVDFVPMDGLYKPHESKSCEIQISEKVKMTILQNQNNIETMEISESVNPDDILLMNSSKELK